MIHEELRDIAGKTISHLEADPHDRILLIYFTDGSFWSIVAEKWNCSGARLNTLLVREPVTSVRQEDKQ